MTSPIWAADIAIDVALAASLVGEQFPELHDAPVTPLGTGWDNAAFLIGGIVFRFPRRRMAIALLEREIALLPALVPLLPARISAPSHVGAPRPQFDRPFAGYELIAGAPICAAPCSDDVRCSIAVPLAKFLKALHAVDPVPFIDDGLPFDDIGRLNPELILSRTRERLAGVVNAIGAAGASAAYHWLEMHPPVAIADEHRRIVHGDLYARHCILAADSLAGVIDWGDLHCGDAALDLAIAHLVLPRRAHGAFRDAYGAIDERTWTAAKVRAMYSAFLTLDYGLREENDEMRDSGLWALGSMSDDLESEP